MYEGRVTADAVERGRSGTSVFQEYGLRAFDRINPDHSMIGDGEDNLFDRLPRSLGRSSYEDQKGEEGIDPEIIGLPPNVG